MRQLACQFGLSRHLVGTLSMPDGSDSPRSVLVLVSAGLTAKHGPHRLHFDIASRLAKRGIAVLRFDLGGIGNSDIADTGLTLAERTHADIRAAVDFLQERFSPEHIILGGLCSGAEDSFRYAESDIRVSGVLMIDAHAFRTRQWYVRHVLGRHFFNRLVTKALRVLGLLKIEQDPRESSVAEGMEGKLVAYQYTEIDEASQILQRLVDRGVYCHYVFTGGRRDVFNHRRQLVDMFPSVAMRGRVSVSHLPQIEHIQLFEEDRQTLIDTLERWLLLACDQASPAR